MKSVSLINLIMVVVVNSVLINPSQGADKQIEQAYLFESNKGDKVEAFKGSFEVLENRNEPSSRKITIEYVRFPATGNKKGSPIVYLSGGPGGSGIGTAKRERFSLFMAMREFGDVIALDQRGTGRSRKALNCTSEQTIAADKVITDNDYFEVQRQGLKDCQKIWKENGIDLFGYTTLESVADLESLRQHLGANKLTLWGISYGTHLALSAIKEMDDRLDRVIIATVEGLDQTVKMPFRTDAYFDRLQKAINTNSELANKFPDIKSLIRRVHNNLDIQPLTLNLGDDNSQSTIVWQRRHMQQVSSGMISDPGSALMLLGIYAALDNKNSKPLTDLLQRYGGAQEDVSFNAMSMAMDIASGQSKQSSRLIMKQAKTSLLSSFLNSSIHYEGIIEGLDLGEKFRQKPISDVPTLVLIGSLDGRIYPKSQQQATSGLKNRTVITVENAGHNLFMTTPEVADIMAKFMLGENLKITTVVAPLPW